MAFSGLQKTRQGLSGIARSLYGLFTGKSAAVVTSIKDTQTVSILAVSRIVNIMESRVLKVPCDNRIIVVPDLDTVI